MQLTGAGLLSEGFSPGPPVSLDKHQTWNFHVLTFRIVQPFNNLIDLTVEISERVYMVN